MAELEAEDDSVEEEDLFKAFILETTTEEPREERKLMRACPQFPIRAA